MSGLALSLLLLGAPVEYQAEFRTVPPELPQEMQTLVEETLKARGQVVIINDSRSDLLASSGERLEIEVVGAVTVVRVTVRRVRATPSTSSPEVVQLERDLPWATWRASLTELLEELYPSVTTEERPPEVDGPIVLPAPRLAEATLPEVNRPSWPLWISGAGLVAMGVGAGFGLKSYLASGDVGGDARFDAEGAMVLRRASDEATVANVMLVSGGLVVAGGLLLYLIGGI